MNPPNNGLRVVPVAWGLIYWAIAGVILYCSDGGILAMWVPENVAGRFRQFWPVVKTVWREGKLAV